MKDKIHFVIRAEPIAHHGFRQVALCGKSIEHAQPIVIVPDAIVVSVTLIADSFGSKMCRHCKAVEPGEGYVYFLAEEEFVESMRRQPEYAEAI